MKTQNRKRQRLFITFMVYCITCFVAAQILYCIMLAFNPVAYHLQPKTWIASFLFVGITTAIFSSGGLAGMWLLTSSAIVPLKDHIKATALIGIIGSGVFFEFTLGEDHLWLGAIFVAMVSIAIAVIVRTYIRVINA